MILVTLQLSVVSLTLFILKPLQDSVVRFLNPLPISASVFLLHPHSYSASLFLSHMQLEGLALQLLHNLLPCLLFSGIIESQNQKWFKTTPKFNSEEQRKVHFVIEKFTLRPLFKLYILNFYCRPSWQTILGFLMKTFQNFYPYSQL